MSTHSQSVPGTPGLKRALRLWDLVFYGTVVIQTTAQMPLFGVVTQRTRGRVVTTVLTAMVAMLLTAISYGRMARAYPERDRPSVWLTLGIVYGAIRTRGFRSERISFAMPGEQE